MQMKFIVYRVLSYNTSVVAVSPTYRKCETEEKTTRYIFYECESLAKIRQSTLGETFRGQGDIKYIGVKDLVKFAKKTELFERF